MTLVVTHPYVSSISESTGSGVVGGTIGPTEWNANHTITGVASSAQLPTDVAYLDVADQTISGGANVTSLGLTTGNVTIDCGARPLQHITNGGVFTITAPGTDGSCLLDITNNASAGAITFSGFSVGTNTGDAFDTTNTHSFTVMIWRNNGVSGYRNAAHQ